MGSRSAVALVVFLAIAAGATAPAAAAPISAERPAASSAQEERGGENRRQRQRTCRARRRGNLYRTPGYGGRCKAPRTDPAPPLPGVVLGQGRHPEALVDAAGTAHIVWNQDGGNGADLLRYCRLKRGSGACDNPPATSALFPAQPGEAAFNEDFAGPRVVAIGDEIALITHRYPNVVDKPDGASSRTTYMWVSSDGGNSFTGPGIVGDAEPSGGATVFGPPDAPRVGVISDTKTGGTFFQSIAPGRYTGEEANLGEGGPDRAYSGSLVTDGGRPMTAFSDLQNRTYIRQWSGAGDPNAAGDWSEAQTAGVEPRLATGPSGTFMVTRPGFGGPLQVRRLNGITPGAAVDVNTTAASDRDLFQDPGGTLRLGWVDGAAGDTRLLERSSRDGARFGSPRILAQSGAPISDVDLGAAGDGGGFALYTAGASSQALGTIVANPFGTQAPTGLPGLGGLPGSGADPDVTATCQEVSYGAVQILADEGCLLGVPGRPAVKVSEGPLRLNGLEIVPDAGVKILLGTRGVRTIDSTGTVTVQLRAPGGPIVLFRGELHIKLPTGAAGVKLASFDAGKFRPIVKGFPVLGDVDVILRREAVEIPISLKLPQVFGGVTGAATLRADNSRGLHLDSVRFTAGRVLLGPVILSDLEVSWTGSTDTWTGGGTITVLGARLTLRAVFERGAYKEGFVSVTPVPFPGLKLAPDVFLNSVSGRFGLSPTFIEAGAFIGAQPLAPPATYVVGVNGTLRVTITPRFAIDLVGNGRLAEFPLAEGALHANADGYLSARGRAEIDLADIVRAGGNFDGFFDTARGQFGATIGMRGCAGKAPIEVCSGFDAIVSSVGVAGCVSGVIGFGYSWRDGGELLGPPSCDIGDYEVKAAATSPRAAQAPQSFTLPRGLPSASVKLTGAGADPPGAVVVSPSGARLAPVPVNAPGAADAPAVFALNGNQTHVGLRRPAGGGWRVEPTPGSAIARVAVANGLTPPRVNARVGGRGRDRVLTYRATARPGLVVRFFEQVGQGGRVVGVVRGGGRGRIRFRAGDGRGGRRPIVAIVEHDGLPRLRRRVASYRAPGPIRPARVRRLRARRTGSAVVARWRGVRGATSYAVRVRVSDGRTILRLVRGRRVRVGPIARTDGVRISVAGRSANGRLGRAARARLRTR